MKNKAILLSALCHIAIMLITLPAMAQSKNCNFRSGRESYEGECKDGQRDGIGTYTFKGGNKYKGEWKAGFMNGAGIFTFVNGDRYEGNFVNGKFNGAGVFAFANGDRYEGSFADGSFSGAGIMLNADKSRYEGSWNENKRSGVGTMTYADGSRYEGGWKDNKRSGAGTLIYPNGYRIDGQWEDDSEVQNRSNDFIKTRKATCKPYSGLIDNKDGTLTDPRNDIVWSRCDLGTKFVKGKGCVGKKPTSVSWITAMKKAREDRTGNYNTWRLPTAEEIQKITAPLGSCEAYLEVTNDRESAAVDLRMLIQEYFSEDHKIMQLDAEVYNGYLSRGDVRRSTQKLRRGHVEAFNANYYAPETLTYIDQRNDEYVRLVRYSGVGVDQNLIKARALYAEYIDKPAALAEQQRLDRNAAADKQAKTEKETQKK